MAFNNTEYPTDFIRRITSQLGEGRSMDLLNAMSSSKEASIRINPLKNYIAREGLDRVGWSDYGYYLPERPVFTLDPHLHAGAYYVQESSSMFIEEIFRQVTAGIENPRILDLCGAPGGKATHLSSLAGDSGLVVANEVIRQRATVLAENVTKWGSPNVIVTNNDPARFSLLDGFFDIMLVDAPCSGEGMFRSLPVKDEWSEANTLLCSERQKRILMDGWPALKKGGLLIYSTCTFNPGENEKNIEWLSGQAGIESVRLTTDPEWGIEEIRYKNIWGYAFYPGRVRGDGFFVSVCRKTEGEQGSGFTGSKGNYRVTVSDRSVVTNWTHADPSRVIRINDLLIIAAAEPSEFGYIRERLSVIKSGTAIAQAKGSVYVPDHELALSTLLRRDAFPYVAMDLANALAYLRRESPAIESNKIGWTLVGYQDSVSGFIKNIGSRINNYYPREWRIRMTN